MKSTLEDAEDPSGSWLMCITWGAMCALSGLWGYHMHACGSVFGAALWTVVIACYLMFFLPAVLWKVGIVLAAVTLVLRAASRHPRLRKEVSLIAFLLTVLLIGIGYAASSAVDNKASCTFHT
jgi:hypothetical protein